MDFTLGPTQQAAAEAAAQVLGGYQPGPEAGPGGGYDRALWKELAQAGLLGLGIPAWLGGEGLGVLDVAMLLTGAGRAAAPVPALATLAMGALPVARWGSREQQQALLTGVAGGDVVLTAAVREPSEPMPDVPATTAALSGSPGTGTVSGVKTGVPYAAAANWILVPASLSTGGTAIVVVDPAAVGVSLRQTPASAGPPEYTLRLDHAPVAHVVSGSGAVADLYRLTAAGACCVADGAMAAALALTTAHVTAREQFGRPLATFQAVAQQIADVSIASRTLHLAALSACWRLDTGRDADDDTEVAAYWLAEEAPAALRACHHLHGGTGMDASYPLHRYSALVKDLVRLVGGADYRLGRLGARIGG